ncbi:MAG: neutral/alkaline non-lysosomal ceramidase N-terminal domain-containing protein [Verrucomicrobia bacterium]|nr:neutral/alkaline non-lysosomal ceramidase N-terminal domain-containing protein [Verrucomicrobiota bacterium]
MRPILLLAFLLTAAPALDASDFQAGTARRNITPQIPFWLSGYAARTNPAARVNHDLWAKALALQDRSGTRVVIVTTDLIGLPHEISTAAANQLRDRFLLPRANILFNSSHTHAGPVVWPNLRVMFDLNPADQAAALAYAHRLADTLAEVASDALTRLEPARLKYGLGQASFAINRRQPASDGVRIGENPAGPVDHDVPVLRIEHPHGPLRAVLFGYACHNTTLVGHNYEIDGDYAGAAQRALEQDHPGTTALFLMLCGGDQNPNPRGTFQLAEQHGKTLAAAVSATLHRNLEPVDPSLQAAFSQIRLEFAPHSRETFETEAQSDHVFRQRRARLMLDAYDRGDPVRSVAYPVQAIRLGANLALLGLGGEVVVDYGLELKKEFGCNRLVVAGYCNEVMCYLPNVRILREGGYEPVDSMIYYGQPGPFTDSVEATLLEAARSTLSQAGFEPAPPTSP